MTLPPLPILGFYALCALIPVIAWLKVEFFKRIKEPKGIKNLLKESLILVVIGGLGFLTAHLLINLADTFEGVQWWVLTLTSLVALIPVIAWIQFIYKKRLAELATDQEKSREKWILLIIFLLGTLTVPLLGIFYNTLDAHPAFDFYTHLSNQWVLPYLNQLNGIPIDSLAYENAYGLWEKAQHFYDTITIIIDALLEEIVKISLMIFFVRSMKLIKTIGDAIAFSVLAGLGFAFIENIIFFVDVYNDPTKNLGIFINVMIFRTIVLSIGHMTFSGIFGYFYGLSKFALPVYEEENWEGTKFPLLKKIAILFHTSVAQVFAMALTYEGLILAMLTHATFNTFIGFEARDYALYLVIGTSIYVYYLTQRKAGHLVLASLGKARMSLMAPRDEDVILELAGMWIREAKYKEVEEICKRLEQKDPDNAVVKLLYAKAHDKRRLKRATLALESLFFQEDIFEEEVSLFERFKQIKEQRGEWTPQSGQPDPYKKEAVGPKGPNLNLKKMQEKAKELRENG